MIELDALIARLESRVAPHDGTPSDQEYEDCAVEAVDDFNSRAPMTRVALISVVAGTAEYSLPVDFIRMISFASPLSPGGVLQTSAGLIPVPEDFRESITIAGLTLVIYPTPTYTFARELQYAAGHVLNSSDEYPYMTKRVMRAVLHKAEALALHLKANHAAQQAWQYQQGDERVNKEKLSAALEAQAEAAEKEYVVAVAKASSGGGATIGMRARYEPGEYGSFAGEV